MTSPFEQTSADLAVGIRRLCRRSQVALFATAGKALTGQYVRWAMNSGLQTSCISVLDCAIRHSIAFACGDLDAVDPNVLAEVERGTPSAPSDVAGFTAAQDCWINVDTALRCGLGSYDAAASSWYLVEPAFQATSERLFGLSDPGSMVQLEVESIALRDPMLLKALAALTDSIELLRVDRPSPQLVDQLSSRLLSIALYSSSRERDDGS